MTVRSRTSGSACPTSIASVRFYCEGLGFEQVASHRVGEEFAALMEVDGVELESRMLAPDGVTIELLGYRTPETTATARRPMNQLGLTHLSLRVDDVDLWLRPSRPSEARWCVPPVPPSTWAPYGSTSSTAPIPMASASSSWICPHDHSHPGSVRDGAPPGAGTVVP